MTPLASTTDSRRNRPAPGREFVLTDEDFEALRTLVKDTTGIKLDESKRDLLYGRLSRRLRHHGCTTFAAYRKLLAADHGGREHVELVNAITTNLTSFFREAHHFDFLKREFLARRAGTPGRIRIWCCAASTGEEPWSIAMTVAEAVPDWQRRDIRILATDIDTNVLATAERATYDEDRCRGLEPRRREKFFDVVTSGGATRFRIKPDLARMVAFRPLNLMQPLPMRGPIDVIFCRNVIIYFDKPTRAGLFGRIAGVQEPGGLLFLGHSENLHNVTDAWTLVGKTIYQRAG